MIYLRLIFALIVGILYIIVMTVLIILTAIFSPKTFDDIFDKPIDL